MNPYEYIGNCDNCGKPLFRYHDRFTCHIDQKTFLLCQYCCQFENGDNDDDEMGV